MIQVSNLTYTYPSAVITALKDVNFYISQGEIFGFLGPSGAGKSTCQKVLYKILQDFRGEILIKNRSLRNWRSDYFSLIGVGFELPNHYENLTARENLQLFSTFYAKESLSPIPELLALVGLEHEIDQLVRTFSKGMKMRLNFVRAIMHNPQILFFDEPTTGLDPSNARLIKEHIQVLKNQGKTIFITTHNMNIADELCDRVAFIVDGQLLETASPLVLKMQHGREAVRVDLHNGGSAEFALDRLGDNPEFLNYIKNQDIVRIHTQEATLEDVFIKVTGKTLKS